jgi:diguanylate cyclase (GGDEF)-like protein/PAS domain S-box-containing protein
MMNADIEPYKGLLDSVYDGIYLLDRNRHIIYWNDGAERLMGFKQSEVLGKTCADKILAHVNDQGEDICRKDCPVTKTIADGNVRELEVFLNHKEGHRVPVQMRVVPLRDANRQIIGAAEILSGNLPTFSLKRRIDFLQKQSLLDPLTNVDNRRALEMKLRSRIDSLKRYGMQFGLLFIDVDHFKDINDRYGHDIGDRVLKMIARTLANSLRPFDTIGRWGGEEFVAIIENIDDTTLSMIAERCRFLVEQSRLPKQFGGVNATVSIGAVISQPADDMETIVREADRLMYRSKKLGRNCVTVDL